MELANLPDISMWDIGIHTVAKQQTRIQVPTQLKNIKCISNIEEVLKKKIEM